MAELTPTWMEKRGAVIEIFHAPSRMSITFQAFITTFSDSYEQTWNPERVFGRMDAYQTYSGTTRTVTIGWKVLSESLEEAKENMKKMSIFAQMQYPTYDESSFGADGINSATTIQGSPIFRLKFLNWIQDSSSPSPNGSAKDNGLVGIMSGFAFNPELNTGYFHDSDGSIYAKEITVDINYTVLHTHDLGWVNRKPINNKFPYGTKIAESSAAPNTSSTDAVRKSREEKINTGSGVTGGGLAPTALGPDFL